MRKLWFYLAMVIVISLTFAGCDTDKKDFEKAKVTNTEAAYETYMALHQDGKYKTQAEELLKQSIVKESMREYQEAKDLAIKAEVSGDWAQALKLWAVAKEKIRYEYIDQSPELKKCEAETDTHSKICKTVIENPASVSGEEVSIGYCWTSFKDDTTIDHRRVKSISAKGKVTNNCPFPISDIKLSCDLYRETTLTINTVTGEDVSRGGGDRLGGISKVVFVGKPLQPGETRRFSISGRVSIDIGKMMGVGGSQREFYMPDPAYSIDIVAYKAR